MRENIVQVFFETAKRQGDRCCYQYKKDGRWQALTWNEAASLVCKIAAGLESKGVKSGDKVAIFSSTRLEWSIADMAIMACGAITVPIYPTLPKERIEHILKDAGIRLIFLESGKLQNTIETIAAHISHPIEIIQIDSPLMDNADPSHIKKRAASIKGDDIASIIYTSGTTGVPKGAVLTHGNMMAEADGASRIFKFRPDEVGFMCLPLAHVLGRLMQFHHLTGGYQVAFMESVEKFAENCRDVRPHFIVGVPRMIEKMHERLVRHVEGASKARRRIFDWAIKIGKEAGGLRQKHRRLPLILRLKHFIASILVFRKINRQLGGRLRLFISGGAPLGGDYAKFFQTIGLLVLEGYGLTETFAAATVNRPDDYHFGTVGKPLPGVEIKLAPDGEVLLRGPTVFREYLNMPDETRAAKTADGWFRTGDIGELSRDGFLRITDRKKDIIVTAGGENVAPQMIESLLMESRFINYCMVYGDKKKYLTALITLDPESIREFASKTGINSDFKSLAYHPQIKDLIASVIKEKNLKLARHETIKKFAILDHDFSVEAGELTPTMKVRRKFTAQKYKEILESLYRD